MTTALSTFPPIHQCPLRYQAMQQSAGIAIALENRNLSFLELDQQVENCRVFLQEKGLEAGDRLLLITGDPLQTVIVLFACLRSQWVFSPVNPVFPAEQVASYRTRIGASIVLQADNLPVSFGHQSASESLSSIPISDTAMFDLVATSGSSGTPKAVAHSYQNHYFSAKGARKALPLEVGDRWLVSLPLFHVGGLAILLRCVLTGATMVMFREKKPLQDMLCRQAVSHVSLVNTQLFRLLNQNMSLSAMGIRFILLGGGAASPDLVERAKRQGICVLTTYGMTEMASQVCTGEPVFVNGCVTSGAPLPDREMLLADNGEILVRGATLALGYFDRGVLHNLLSDDGWFHTRDTGEWHQNQIKVLGRLDNMMVSGGENIHPEEIEQALTALSGIIQAVVVPYRNAEFGQRPVAFVQTVDGKLNEKQLKCSLTDRLSRFKIPEQILLFPDGIVETGVKVNRNAFKKLLA